MNWNHLKNLIQTEIASTPVPAFVNNANDIFNKSFWNNIAAQAGLLCNPDNKEMLKIDFVLSKKAPHGYHVPIVFVEVEDNIDSGDEETHEVCKLAATNALQKVFVTRYNGDWQLERDPVKLQQSGKDFDCHLSTKVSDYAHIQQENFNPEIHMIVVENLNNQVNFHYESWDVQQKRFVADVN